VTEVFLGVYTVILDRRETGFAATELLLRVHLGLKLTGPLCAAI
jgi:hypothetical protein